MKKFIQNKLKDQKGLTLIELLAVIVILAIIAAIAIPAIGNIIGNSRVNALKSDGQNALSAANIYFTENGSKTTVTIPTLLSEGYLDDAGNLSKDTASKVDKIKGGNKITAVAKNGDVTVTFTAATNSDIAAEGTEANTTAPITIAR